ncbi:MAG TPA: Hsp70 family protein [Candidatus Limnocylindrales bacterium]
MNSAIVVGCAGYEDPDIAPLRYAARDAANVAVALREACGVPPENLIVLHDDVLDPRLRPTRSNILRQVIRASADSTPDGVLFFFFSGHGFSSPHGTHFLLPVDCLRDAIEETALRFDTLVGYLGRAAAPHTVLMLDACRNVVEGGKSVLAPQPVDVAALCPPGLVSLCSCEPGRVSYEADGLEAGIFSAALCEALSDIGRCRTVYELDTYLAKRVPQLTAANGKPRQVPFSRVEPLSAQHLEIVSGAKSSLWRGMTPIGSEIRPRRTPRMAEPVSADALAIDFGTSYSLVATVGADRRPVVVPGPDGRLLIPSVVSFQSNLDYFVGATAQENERVRPHATIRHMKRALGSGETYDIDGRSITPELAASLVIRSLRRNAEEALGSPVTRCLASYPANFNRAQIAALRTAFDLAGLEVTRLVGEPNLAGLGLNLQREATWLVIDLGGGTFDVALLESGDGLAEIRAASGSNAVGGLDFDRALVDHASRILHEEHGLPDAVIVGVRPLIQQEAERAKRELGRGSTATLMLDNLPDPQRGTRDVAIDVDRAQFRRLTAPLNQQIRATIERVIAAAPESGPPDAVVLAGQGAKIFTVGEVLFELQLAGKLTDHHPDTAVVRGGALHAGVLAGLVKQSLLLDVVAYGVAVRCQQLPGTGTGVIALDPTMNTELSHLIGANTFTPTRSALSFRLEGGAERDHLIEFVEVRHDGVHPMPEHDLHASAGLVNVYADFDSNQTLRTWFEADA